MKKVYVCEHAPNEKAGTILDFMKINGIPYEEIRLFEEGYSFPDTGRVGALIVMGGPMNVYEEDKHPFLKEENAFIQEAVRRKIPYLGVCLGSQLLAKALGAKVYKAARPEVGWDCVRLSPEARKKGLFRDMPSDPLKVLQWHEDTFDLPKGAVHLASSEVVPNQAYEVDGLFYGFQFHVEVNRPMLEDWFKDKPNLKEILAEYDRYRPELEKLTESIYRRFFDLSGLVSKKTIDKTPSSR
jgi:GMP synthase (glutamine-hydrolysing)